MNMTKRHLSLLTALSLVLASAGPLVAFAATTPTLGLAGPYGVLASTYTNTTAGTIVNGSVGFTTGPAVAPIGTHADYGSGGNYSAAGTAQGAALGLLAAQPCTYTFPAGAINLSTDTSRGGTPGLFFPGVYCSTGAMDVGGPVTLSGSGTYIFRAVGALTTDANSFTTLAGASACDVFWTPTQATTLAANTTFAGTVISDSGITVGANSTWTGHALAFGGTVTTGDQDNITVPNCAPPPPPPPANATLHVIKHVINDNSGTETAAMFNLHVKLAGSDVVGSPNAGAETPGTPYSLVAGSYVVSEDPDVLYTSSFSGDCDASGNITLLSGEDKTCTITNNDVVPPVVLPTGGGQRTAAPTGTINVVKVVVNDNGGTKVVSDFPLFINGAPITSGDTNTFIANANAYYVTETSDPNYTATFSGDCDPTGLMYLHATQNLFCVITNNDKGAKAVVPPLIDLVKVPSPLALPNGPGAVNYAYTVRNVGTVPMTDVTLTDDSCSPSLVSGDTNGDNKLDVNETWAYTCNVSLTATHTNNAVATGWANGLSAVDIAAATVIVGAPVVPPLIHVTKLPNPLALNAGGGLITYTEKVTNPGTVPLNNVQLADDKCSPLNLASGDANGNGLLEVDETWTYTCTSRLTETTTNTAVATGMANGLTARDFAIATVVVAAPVPRLPNTGFAPSEAAAARAAALAGLLAVSLLAYALGKKRRA